MSYQRIDELYERVDIKLQVGNDLREILEPVALVKATTNLPPGFLDAMRKRTAEADPSPGDIGATLDRLEEDLHVTRLGCCGNQALMQTQTQSLLVAHRFLYRWTSADIR